MIFLEVDTHIPPAEGECVGTDCEAHGGDGEGDVTLDEGEPHEGGGGQRHAGAVEQLPDIEFSAFFISCIFSCGKALRSMDYNPLLLLLLLSLLAKWGKLEDPKTHTPCRVLRCALFVLNVQSSKVCCTGQVDQNWFLTG